MAPNFVNFIGKTNQIVPKKKLTNLVHSSSIWFFFLFINLVWNKVNINFKLFSSLRNLKKKIKCSFDLPLFVKIKPTKILTIDHHKLLIYVHDRYKFSLLLIV